MARIRHNLYRDYPDKRRGTIAHFPEQVLVKNIVHLMINILLFSGMYNAKSQLSETNGLLH